jgi:hypothetical protein
MPEAGLEIPAGCGSPGILIENSRNRWYNCVQASALQEAKMSDDQTPKNPGLQASASGSARPGGPVEQAERGGKEGVSFRHGELHGNISSEIANLTDNKVSKADFNNFVNKDNLEKSNFENKIDQFSINLMSQINNISVNLSSDMRNLGSEIRELGADISNVRTEISNVRTELGADISSVRAEIGNVRAELGADISNVRAEIGNVRAEIGNVRTELGAKTSGIENTLEQHGRELNRSHNFLIAIIVGIVMLFLGALFNDKISYFFSKGKEPVTISSPADDSARTERPVPTP